MADTCAEVVQIGPDQCQADELGKPAKGPANTDVKESNEISDEIELSNIQMMNGSRIAISSR
jgi:hypothetical protein